MSASQPIQQTTYNEQDVEAALVNAYYTIGHLIVVLKNCDPDAINDENYATLDVIEQLRNLESLLEDLGA